MSGNNMEKIVVRLPAEGLALRVMPGENLLEVLRANGLPIISTCGGRGTCKKCLVKIDGGEPVLACGVAVEQDMEVVIVARETGFDVLQSYSPAVVGQAAGNACKKIAVDIGTTTVAAQLVAQSGMVLGARAFVNSQRRFGADVITRIQAADEGNLKTLSDIIAAQLLEAVKGLCADTGVPPAEIAEVHITGNTTMIHLLLGLDCHALGQYPFTPEHTIMESYGFGEVFHSEFLSCSVRIWPWISAFVGGDIAAGIAYCQSLDPTVSAWLLVDMGTNGEMALFDNGRLTCTSTAAGPAFEGGNISCGTGGVPGAIAAVDYADGEFKIKTIGGASPIGLCGSGVLDAAACLVKGGFVDETGLLADDYFVDGVEIAKAKSGERVIFTQKDVRELQLAKSAVRAGIEILLKECGTNYNDIGALYLSGGFGQNLRVSSAAGVGLIPRELEGRVVPCGNSALGGCVLGCMEPALLREAAAINSAAKELNLSAHPDFNNYFMDYMEF